MKIGIYDPYLDDMGGGEKYMLTLAESLSHNNQVSLFWDNKEELDLVLKRFSIDVSKIKISPNIFSNKVTFLKRALESRKYDVIILVSDGSFPILFSKKVFIHIQQPLLDAPVNLKTKFKILKINKVFCNSYFTKQYVDKKFRIDSIVVYPPVDIHPKNIEKENIILHVGRFRAHHKKMKIVDYKKQSVMVEEFKKMVDLGLKKWKFIIAAGVKDEQTDEFEKLVKEAEDYPIEFMVNKTNQELWDIYSKSKIYWHASGYGEDLEMNPELAEHFGISTVEAMGAGVVPVVINAGGQKEIVTDNVNGFLWNNLGELKEKTNILIKEDKIWESMSEEAKKRAKDFSKERFADEVKRMVEND